MCGWEVELGCELEEYREGIGGSLLKALFRMGNGAWRGEHAERGSLRKLSFHLPDSLLIAGVVYCKF